MNCHPLAKKDSLIVDIGFYKGPLYILYHILERREVSIGEIGMQEIVRQLRSRSKERFDLDLIESSIHLIYRLLLLKIESLLSSPENKYQMETMEEKEEDVDDFYYRMELARIKKLSVLLREILEKSLKNNFLNEFVLLNYYDRVEESIIANLSSIISSYSEIFLNEHEFPLKKTLSKIEISIDEIREKILIKLRKEAALMLKKDLIPLVCKDESKLDRVLTFWTVLSLEKDRKILTRQENNFEDIEIIKRNAGSNRQEINK